jgi:plasmid stabilization system protein ParE
MFEVIWLPEALADLEGHFDFLNEKSPKAASRASRTILNAAASLANFPERGMPITGTQQRKLRIAFGKDGYVLYYRVDEQSVFVLRLHHGRENRPR